MELKIEYVDINTIKPYERNAKEHPDWQIKQIIESIEQFGMNDPIAVDKHNVIIEGHGRYLACREMGNNIVPVIHLDDLTDEQRKAYTLIHNKLTMNSGFDIDILKDELEDIVEINMDDFGFDLSFLDEIDKPEEQEETEEDDGGADPEDVEHRVKPGDVWKLGNHRLMCGDSTSITDIEKLLGDKKADLVFTDPPYGMKKEKDGVANDNLNYDDLFEFNRQWIPITFDVLKENGSWYCWGIDEPLMDIYSNILKPMQKANQITFRNLITWDKGDAGAGGVSFMGKEGLRSYPVSDEKCLFVMSGVQGFNNNSDNYYEAWEPIRTYLEGEAKKVGLDNKKLKEICGVGMYAHWFTKSQWGLITEEHYKKLQAFYGQDAFKKDYDSIKKDWYETRAYFDNTHDKMTTVWQFNRVKGEEREAAGGHATPKPIALCGRAIKSSSRKGEIVLDVFGGSGSTLIACEQLGRVCYMNELEPKWCDVIIDRWEKLTGQTAELIDDGEGYKE